MIALGQKKQNIRFLSVDILLYFGVVFNGGSK